jgi:hypothetical protein
MPISAHRRAAIPVLGAAGRLGADRRIGFQRATGSTSSARAVSIDEVKAGAFQEASRSE